MSEPNTQSGGYKGLPIRDWDGNTRYSGPAIEERATHPGSKNTRRWCHGRVGVEHEPVWQFWFGDYLSVRHRGDKPTGVPMEYQQKKCVNCGRYLGSRKIRSDIPPSRQ